MKAKQFLYLALVVAAGCAPTLFDGGVANEPKPVPVMPYLRPWQVAFERDGDIWIANGDGSQQKLLIKDASAATWHPDGDKLAFFRDGQLMLAHLSGDSIQRVTSLLTAKQPLDAEGGASWDPVRNELIFGWITGEGTSGIWSVGENAGLHKIDDLQPSDTGAYYTFGWNACPAWSPSGAYMALVRNGDVWLCSRIKDEQGKFTLEGWGTQHPWDVTRLAATAEFDAPTYRGSRQNYGVTKLSWSADEKQLAYGIRRLNGSGFYEIHVLSVNAGESQISKPEATDTLIDEGYDPAFCPDGRTLSYVKQDDVGEFTLIVRTREGKATGILKDAWHPAWRPLKESAKR